MTAADRFTPAKPARRVYVVEGNAMIALTRERRIDWPRIIENLRRVGMSHADIAEAVDVGTTTVVAYADDRCIEPAFWTGSALLVLWSKRTGLPYTDAPTRIVTPSVSRVLKASA
jgi:hypothetical protein